MATCSDYVLPPEVRRICCDKRVRVPKHYNSESVFSLNFSCRGCVGRALDANFHTQDRTVYGRLRSLEKSRIEDVACRCLPILYCPQGISP